MKRGIVTITLLASVLLITMALAIPNIQVTVQQVSVGSNQVHSPVNRAHGVFVIDSNNNQDYVSSVEVSFDSNLTVGSIIYVKIYGKYPGGNPIAIGKIVLNATLTNGTFVNIPLNISVPIRNVGNVGIVVQSTGG